MNSLLEFLERRDLQWYTKSDWREAETAALTGRSTSSWYRRRSGRKISPCICWSRPSRWRVSRTAPERFDMGSGQPRAICTERKRYCQVVTLPDGLRQELLSTPFERCPFRPNFSRAAEAVEPHDRHISDLTSGQGRGLEPGKILRSLKGLYQNTFADYQRQADVWMKNATPSCWRKRRHRRAGWRKGDDARCFQKSVGCSDASDAGFSAEIGVIHTPCVLIP